MKVKRHQTKQILSVILVFLLTISTSSPVFAATARATTMKLEKSEGTVTVKTQNGASRKTTNGMRLYNGNSVETGKSSYAFISLDSSKAVKLSENANASLRQNGKKLELLVKKGQLFFNVSTKLGKDESMNIRTSTMVTGIRGTCGIVENVSSKVSKLYLLEGKVTLGGTNPVTVQGGEVATINISAPQHQAVVVEAMKEKDIPVFAVKEVLTDPVLKEKIEKNSDLSIEKMKEAYEEAMKAEEEKQEEKPTETPEEKPKEPETPSIPSTPTLPETPNKPSVENPPTGDNGDTGNTGNTEGTNPPSGDNGTGDSSGGNVIEKPADPVIPNPGTSYDLDGTVSIAELQKALKAYEVVRILKTASVVYPATTVEAEAGCVTVPANRTLIVDAVYNKIGENQYKGPFHMQLYGKLVLEEGAKLYVNGNIAGGSIEMKNNSAIYVNNQQDGLGIIDSNSMVASGSVTIINNNIIKLQKAFTKSVTAAVTTVDYQCGADSVLVSGSTSDAMAKEGNNHGTLLASAVSGNSANSDGNITVQYIYADYLNALAAKYINDYSATGSSITWNFEKDAVVPVWENITLSNLNANLGTHQIQVEGNLTLNNIEAISGSGDAVIYMKTGGHLIFDREKDLLGSSKYKFDNRAHSKTAIVVEELSVAGNAEKTTRIEWKDPDLYIQTALDDPQYSIQGTEVEAGTKVATNEFVSLPEEYEMIWDNQGLCLNPKAVTAATQ